MTSIIGGFGALLIATSAATGLWLTRRELLRRRARARLDAPTDASDASEDHREQAPPVAIQASLWPSLIVSLATLVVCTLWGWSAIVSSGIAAVTATLCHVLLASRAQRRALQLEEGLAEAVSLASSALRAGSSPVDALERAARAVQGPARAVLLDLSGRVRLGDDATKALEALVERVPLESYRLFAIALSVQWRAGGSLERSLGVVARAVRDRVELERRIQTQAAPTNASIFAFVAATAGIAYLMWQNDPANLEHFLASTTGSNLVGGAIWLQAIGTFWIWRMAQVRV